jgi:hypothetical protein
MGICALACSGSLKYPAAYNELTLAESASQCSPQAAYYQGPGHDVSCFSSVIVSVRVPSTGRGLLTHGSGLRTEVAFGMAIFGDCLSGYLYRNVMVIRAPEWGPSTSELLHS